MSAWRTWRRGAVVAGFLCLLGTPSVSAGARNECTKHFVPGAVLASLDWHSDQSWDPVGVPAPTDVACVLADGSYKIDIRSPVEIAGLKLDVADGTVTLKAIGVDVVVNGPALIAGDTKLKINDGAVLRSDTGGVVEVRSQLVIEGGTVAMDIELFAKLNWTGPGSVTGQLTTHPGSTIEVEGPVAAAHLTVAQGFENHGSIMFNDTIEQSLEVLSGRLVNAAEGTIGSHVVAGGPSATPELRAELENHGAVAVDGVDLALARGGSDHLLGGDGSVLVSDAELVVDLSDLGEAASNFTNYGSMTVATGGTIRVGGATQQTEAASNFTNYGSMTVATGGTIRVGGATQEQGSVAFVNSGSVTIHDGGLVEIVGASFENSGDGLVEGEGELDLADAVSVVYDGRLSPGLPLGTFTVGGSLPLGAAATVEIEAAGVAPGADLDRLDVGAVLAAGGSLDVSLSAQHDPVAGNRYQILTFGTLDGWFDHVVLPPLQHLLGWFVDVGSHEVALDVVCDGTQLVLTAVADRDPVSIDHEFLLELAVDNPSGVAASQVVLGTELAPEVVFLSDLSSPGCAAIGSTVECPLADLPAGGRATATVGLKPLVTGSLMLTAAVESWECDTVPADNTAVETVDVVAAAPCDANFDLQIDSDDLLPAADHIFGTPAVGNPDCRVGNGVTADDLAAIIDAAHSAP